MRYRSQAGILSVYIVAEGHSLEQEGGFPEVSCSDPCADETRLAKSEGNYYLEVRSANGPWTITIEELR